MSAPAASLHTYVWHYLVARSLYDGLARGHWPALVVFVAVVTTAYTLIRARRRSVRRGRQRRI